MALPAMLSLLESTVMDIPASVRHTTSKVVSSARHVTIAPEAISKFARNFRRTNRHWIEDSPVPLEDLPLEARLRMIFAFNAISFSYWGTPNWTISYRGKNYNGTWAMLIALRKAIQREPEAFRPEWLASLEECKLREILAGPTALPLLKERLTILTDLGRVFLDHSYSTIEELIEDSGFSALNLLDSIITLFPSFVDEGSYKGKTVAFYKRAQLLVADVSYVLSVNTGYGLRESSCLTACADYKIPQVLRHFGILAYSPDLSKRVDEQQEILSGCQEEVEIRAATIQAIELAVAKIQMRGIHTTAMELNDLFWLAGQPGALEMKPYHRTRSCSY